MEASDWLKTQSYDRIYTINELINQFLTEAVYELPGHPDHVLPRLDGHLLAVTPLIRHLQV